MYGRPIGRPFWRKKMDTEKRLIAYAESMKKLKEEKEDSKENDMESENEE